MPGQAVLFCSCGALAVQRTSGLCPRCLRRRRLSAEKFDGKREDALGRDGYACVACAGIDALLVHHRKRRNLLRWLATLCRKCHPRVHHSSRCPYHWPELLKQLWREQHSGQAEQLELPLSGVEPAARQADLF
jgi:hypothetical protein